ncbi:hypothetical protein J2754_003273 [Halarchaeum solikamskense]|uniref:hypothetical protein n=1 Tax=Halarchaeum nitratireducens TaxID=489913 RepID=UPI001B3A9AE9|nr:hypothetical protein [Halarchaeum solikamskense]MBP2252911.1 hypothetical protein [Halarchaeum solikamskense]
MEDPERPGPDADAAEIAEWMEKDFGRAVAEGIANAGDEDDPDDEHEVVEVEILNYERGEVVGTIDTDGKLDTESEALREVSQEYIDEGIPVLVPTTYENEDGETVHADAEVMVEPGTTGFVRAFVDELPSPFDCDTDVLRELPVFEPE